MVMNPPAPFDNEDRMLRNLLGNGRPKQKRKYKRKGIPESEQRARKLRQQRQKQYEQIMSRAKDGSPSLWSFESLFPEPYLDENMADHDLFEVKRRDSNKSATSELKSNKCRASSSARTTYAGNPIFKLFSEPKAPMLRTPNVALNSQPLAFQNDTTTATAATASPALNATATRVDRGLSRMVADRLYGYKSTQKGDVQYETSLMGDGAVQFREGVRLGNPLSVNADRLNYHAKKELQKGRVEEAKELYTTAVRLDPRDGRAYLGLSRCAQRRRDFKLARECLQTGIANAAPGQANDGNMDRGSNPFLLQALGHLEEKMGHLSQAEELYIAACKSRPSHAAAWVSLAQLRTRKLGQSANVGRICYQTAERELQQAGMKPSAYVYTAWAALEYRKARQTRRARELFQSALEVDPKCSAAWLQLGVLESECENWEAAQECFETVLKFDQRNSRVLQAYALMETKRPNGDSREAVGLFERALGVNPRDAGVLQAYALYVAQLGDIDAARELLRRGTEVDKRHPAVWQAWGVLETRHGKAQDARNIFQQGIWNCAQMTGNQSGGHKCARLWQAWGVLEAQEGNQAAARRCFSRALDANHRNVPAITAWALMEEELGNDNDARSIFERALKRFSPGCEEKMSLWRNYELMEQRLGNSLAAQHVYERATRETLTIQDEVVSRGKQYSDVKGTKGPHAEEVLSTSNEVEVVRWNGGGRVWSGADGEVWLNDRAIESRLPFDAKRRKESKPKRKDS